MRERIKKIHITTLGCEKNLVDSEAMAGYLNKKQFEICDKPEESDIIIINTCGFIKAAKEESIDAILEAGELKKAGKVKKVLVAGCMSVRYKEQLSLELPEVDAFFGTEDYKKIAGYLGQTHLESIEKIYSKRNLSGPRHYGYMKISEGCDHECSFCAIPLMRGKHRSRSLETLIDEANMLVSNGAKELVLIAQDSTYWGRDINDNLSVINLLQKLEEIPELQWIRLMYLYPNSIPAGYIEYMQSSEKLVPYVDIPLQHASSKMLKLMERGGSRKSLIRLIENFRKHIENIVIRSTFIVGHPGETESDFNELLEFIHAVEFNRVGAFTYSDEDNTRSSLLSRKVADPVKEERYNRLMEAQQEISLKHNLKMVGRKYDILIDNYDPIGKVMIGRTYGDAPEIDNEVLIEGIQNAEKYIGTFVNTEIIDAQPYELFGKIDH